MAQNKKIKHTTMTARALVKKINEELKTKDTVVIENVLIPSKIQHGTQFINMLDNFPHYYIDVDAFNRDKTDFTLKSKCVEFRNCKLRDAELVFSSYNMHNELHIIYTECEVQHFGVQFSIGKCYNTFIDCKVQNCLYNTSIGYNMHNTNIIADSNTTFEYCVFERCEAKKFIRNVGEKFVNCKFNDCDFVDADLSKTTFTNCFADTNTRGFQLVCPEKGEYIAFKMARVLVYDKSGKSAISDMIKGKYKHDKHVEYVIVELRIPKDAKRSSATTRKCRASKAEVLSITSIDGKKHYKKALSQYRCDGLFVYEVGKTVVPDNGFEENRWIECAAGIHHFITRDEAVAYKL